MGNPREIVLLAQTLYERLGPKGIVLCEARAEERRRADDLDGAEFWRRVSRGLILVAVAPSAVKHPDSPSRQSSLWTLMQRIEGYRHLAAEAESAAEGAGEPGRRDLMALARGWRELVALFEGLSEAGAEYLPPEPAPNRVYELN
jgi:hypothetical protein